MKIIGFKWIPLEQLRVHRKNIRQSQVQQEKEALKLSIKKKEILDVLTVVYQEDEQIYDIIKGQRRFLAAKELRNEGIDISKLPCIVKEMTDTEATEESLLDELMRVSVEPNDTGLAVLELIDHYGDVNKVGTILGVPPDWLDYYVEHRNLNPPATVIESEPTKSKSSLEDYTKEEEEIKTGEKTEFPTSSPFSDLSIDERKEAQRRLQETPSASPIVLKSAVKDWMEHSFELQFRMEDSVYRGLKDWAQTDLPEQEISVKVKIPKKGSISPRRALDILVNVLVKEFLKEAKYI